MLVLLHGALLPQTTTAQEDTLEATLEPVTITAGILPVQLLHATRTVEIIDAQMLEQTQALSVDDALRTLSSVHVQRRGAHGAQSDLNIRGGTFGQTLVLFNGIRFNDPQTGHHALRVPIPVSMIERIEVLPGHGSALLGPDALGGAVNIVPALGGTHALHVEMEAASHGLWHAAVGGRYGGESLPSHTAVSYRSNDGWREGTDMQSLSVSHISRASVGGGILNLLAGYSDQDIGAFDFYSPGRGIPSRERIRVGYAALQGSRSIGSLLFNASVSLRDLRDRFQFDVRIPDRSINEHRTRVLNATLQGVMPVTADASLRFGLEANGDDIRSNSLGTHARQWLAATSAARWKARQWMEIDAGLRWDMHSRTQPYLSPTLGVRVSAASALALRFSAGRSFRLPTYTNLYYEDPVNRGNAALQPETAISSEAGLDWQPDPDITVSTDVFHRAVHDLIDYVQAEPEAPFIAMNHTEALVTGATLKLGWSAQKEEIIAETEISLSILDMQLNTGDAWRSRYAFTSPPRQLKFRFAGHLGAGLHYMILATAVDQHVARDYGTVDARLRRTFGDWMFHLAADNLTNSAIEEFPGLPLPGRWLRAGVSFHH